MEQVALLSELRAFIEIESVLAQPRIGVADAYTDTDMPD
jgi:hypothetical protein